MAARPTSSTRMTTARKVVAKLPWPCNPVRTCQPTEFACVVTWSWVGTHVHIVVGTRFRVCTGRWCVCKGEMCDGSQIHFLSTSCFYDYFQLKCDNGGVRINSFLINQPIDMGAANKMLARHLPTRQQSKVTG